MKKNDAQNDTLNNSYLDEGYIKYHCEWLPAPTLADELIASLNQWRQYMYELQLIGYYPKYGVGYGNISIRHPHYEDQFIISGTQTGHLKTLQAEHYTTVSDFNLAQNTLTCKGTVKASSESLTHAAIYELSPTYKAVIHVHHFGMWSYLTNKVSTTLPTIPYGTPEMAYDIDRLYKNTDLVEQKIIVMAGHEEGIIVFGENIEAAGNTILAHYQQFIEQQQKSA